MKTFAIYVLLLLSLIMAITETAIPPPPPPPTPEPETPEQKACNDFNLGGQYETLLDAKEKDECSVTCTFQQQQFYGVGYSSGSTDSAGVSTQPVAAICDKDGKAPTVVIDVGANSLQTCGQDKVCVRGVCTPQDSKVTPECQENVATNSIAVEGLNKCLIKCVTNEPKEYNGRTADVLTTVNLPMPDRSPCGENMMCRGRDCLSASLFSAKC